MGCGFCKYDMTTADIDNMKLDSICLESSVALKETQKIDTGSTQLHPVSRKVKRGII